MVAAKARQVHAQQYASKYATLAAFAAGIELNLKVDENDAAGEIEHQVNELWAQLVVGDHRWETRASFANMVTEIILKISKSPSTSASATSGTSYEELVLRLLNGEGQGKGGDGDRDEAFPGLVGMMGYGEPQSCGERKVEMLSFELSNWAVSEGGGQGGREGVRVENDILMSYATPSRLRSLLASATQAFGWAMARRS